MNQQDEALKLANEYRQTMPYDVMKDWGADVAAELRRQHQEIQELKRVKEELLDAIKAELDPSWECNSRHPKMYVMFTKHKD